MRFEPLPRNLAALAEIVASIPPYAVVDDEDALIVAERWIRRSSPLDLAWLSGRWRTARSARPPVIVPNEQIRKDTLAWVGSSVERMALASLHCNGFVRETAVRLLAEQDDGFELPFLLLRSNDWTANVHRAAHAAVSKRITIGYAVHWARAIALVNQLRDAWRYRDILVRMVEQVDALLLTPAARPALCTAFVSGEQAARRACLTLICSLPKAESEAMLFEGLRDRDPLIASRSARALLDHAEGDRLVRFLERTLHHPLVRVRGFALEAARRLEPEAKARLFREALLDRERSLRESARHEVSRSDKSSKGADHPIAEPVRRALLSAIDHDDVGYADPRGLGDAFAPWARKRWGWEVAPADVRVAPDVVTAIGELLQVTTKLGEGVVIDPPVYPPFASTIRHLGRTVVETPLAQAEDGDWRLDLDAIERAYSAGARAHLLCSPHNPTGTVHSRSELARVAKLARRHDVVVISDEIHAPLTHPGAEHLPFPTVSADAARSSIVLTSASKTWNLAGLKSAVMVATHEHARAILARVPPDFSYHAGHLGVLGARAAFEHGDTWLASTSAILERNRVRLGELLAEHLPGVRYAPPAAGYLAWLDCRALEFDVDPTKAFLDRGRVALTPGPSFGTGGEGFARLNFATTQALLEEAVVRMRAALR